MGFLDNLGEKMSENIGKERSRGKAHKIEQEFLDDFFLKREECYPHKRHKTHDKNTDKCPECYGEILHSALLARSTKSDNVTHMMFRSKTCFLRDTILMSTERTIDEFFHPATLAAAEEGMMTFFSQAGTQCELPRTGVTVHDPVFLKRFKYTVDCDEIGRRLASAHPIIDFLLIRRRSHHTQSREYTATGECVAQVTKSKNSRR